MTNELPHTKEMEDKKAFPLRLMTGSITLGLNASKRTVMEKQ